jgi:hypothetical protein
MGGGGDCKCCLGVCFMVSEYTSADSLAYFYGKEGYRQPLYVRHRCCFNHISFTWEFNGLSMGCQYSLFWNKHQLIDFGLGGNNHSPNTYIGGTERPTSFTCKMNGLPMLCVCVCVTYGFRIHIISWPCLLSFKGKLSTAPLCTT